MVQGTRSSERIRRQAFQHQQWLQAQVQIVPIQSALPNGDDQERVFFGPDFSKSTDPCVCKICGYPMSRSKDVLRHVQIHGGFFEKFPCPFTNCKYSARQKSNLDTHLKTSIHADIKDLHCDIGDCSSVFSDASALSRHKKRPHPLVRPLAPRRKKVQVGSGPTVARKEVAAKNSRRKSKKSTTARALASPPSNVAATSQLPVVNSPTPAFQDPLFLNNHYTVDNLSHLLAIKDQPPVFDFLGFPMVPGIDQIGSACALPSTTSVNENAASPWALPEYDQASPQSYINNAFANVVSTSQPTFFDPQPLSGPSPPMAYPDNEDAFNFPSCSNNPFYSQPLLHSPTFGLSSFPTLQQFSAPMQFQQTSYQGQDFDPNANLYTATDLNEFQPEFQSEPDVMGAFQNISMFEEQSQPQWNDYSAISNWVSDTYAANDETSTSQTTYPVYPTQLSQSNQFPYYPYLQN